jgi:hypothetical protein
MLRSLLILTFILFLSILINAQEISNIHFEQEGKMINIYYDLSGSDKYDIKVYCSQDGGTNWSKQLKQVTGAVGLGQIAGTNKKITWNVLAEQDRLMGDIKFKIEASPTTGCGSITVDHIAGNVAPVTKAVTYGTVRNIPGEPQKCWITSNLGSDRQAFSVYDSSEAAAGWYWQFNRKQGYKHTGVARIPNSNWINSINENSDWAIVNDPCSIELASGWRIPTQTEWANVVNNGEWSKWNGPWYSELKLHAAGSIVSDEIFYRGSEGYFWSSSQRDSFYGWELYFNRDRLNVNFNTKALGNTIRCLREW